MLSESAREDSLPVSGWLLVAGQDSAVVVQQQQQQQSKAFFPSTLLLWHPRAVLGSEMGSGQESVRLEGC